MFLKILTILSVVAIAACSTNNGTTDITIYGDLNKDHPKYYVAMSADDYNGSEVANMISINVATASSTYAANKKETVEEALASADEKDSTYMIYPEISDWKHEALERTSEKAKVTMVISIYDVKSKKIFNKAVLDRKCVYEGLEKFEPKDCINLNLWMEKVIR